MDLKGDYDYCGDNCVKSCLRAMSKSLGPTQKSQQDCVSRGGYNSQQFSQWDKIKRHSFSLIKLRLNGKSVYFFFLLANTKLSWSCRTEEQRLYFILKDVQSSSDGAFHASRLFSCQRERWPVYWQFVEWMEACVTAYLKRDVPAGGRKHVR